jgi:hypothetical protein
VAIQNALKIGEKCLLILAILKPKKRYPLVTELKTITFIYNVTSELVCGREDRESKQAPMNIP